MPHLDVKNLSKSFTLHMLGGRKLPALEDVSFAVERGEFLGVVGRSGSGKSSLLRCLYRSYLPTGGRILYDSREDGPVDLAAADDRAVLRLREEEIGYASQFLRAIPRLSARAVVAEPLTRRGVAREEAIERADAALAALGLDPEIRETLPSTMSGGERQRVNLARALVARPRLLLLDEPTSALDPATRELAVEAILALKREGTTMVGIFHDDGALRALTERVLVLKAGRVFWSGPAEEVPGPARVA